MEERQRNLKPFLVFERNNNKSIKKFGDLKFMLLFCE